MKPMAEKTSSAPFPIEEATDQDRNDTHHTRLLALLAAGGLMVGVIVIFALLSSVTPRWSEFVKIIAVVMFVGSMIALALGMVGDSFRRR